MFRTDRHRQYGIARGPAARPGLRPLTHLVCFAPSTPALRPSSPNRSPKAVRRRRLPAVPPEILQRGTDDSRFRRAHDQRRGLARVEGEGPSE